jgi:hypothetical protein
MADPLALAELEFRIALLPAISRAAHLDGPGRHAERLIKLWRVADDESVPFAQSFRLLRVKQVEGAILRTLMAGDYPSDPRRCIFPPLNDLLPELQALSWRAMQNGDLLVEGIKGTRGRVHHAIRSAELLRLTPDWVVGRLCDGTHGAFTGVRVRCPPAAPVKPTWRPEKPPQADLENWLKNLAEQEYPDAERRPDSRPTFDVLQKKANKHFKTVVPRDDLRAAIDDATQLKRSPGQRTVK